MASPCEMPAGVGGFISFHLMRKHQISQWLQTIISHPEDISLKNKNYNPARKGWFDMGESKLRDLSTDFAVNIIKLCENVKGHYSLVNQLERSATSIGANIREANYAHGKPDFIAKLQIALKECYETEYWLELFVKSDILDREATVGLYNQCGTIRRMLIASINTAKGKQ